MAIASLELNHLNAPDACGIAKTMKSDDKLLSKRLEVAQIEIALDSKTDMALSMQDDLMRREILLKEAINTMTDDERKPLSIH